MTVEKIIGEWKKQRFKPIYWLDGEEDYYIDKLMQYAEHQILSESEASFNLSVFYGKDVQWPDLINACRRYPMFAERQVVLLKEAHQMKEIEMLCAYVEQPMPSTVLIIGFKGKNLDKRKKLFKLLQQHAEIFTSPKLKEDQVPEWIQGMVNSKGLSIQSKAARLLLEHTGADLSRIESEVEKISVNLGAKKEIDENDIEKFIGISKEYNVFELVSAIAKKSMPKALKILNYFEANPKAAPIQMALPAMYSTFGKVYAAFGLPDQSDGSMRPMFYNNPLAVAQARDIMRNYGFEGVCKILLLMNEYNLKSIGVGGLHSENDRMIKEMVTKMMI
jgi:DNA polymerase-3 subunit delta